MRKILLLFLLCISIGVNAQRIDKPGEPYDYFCNIQLGGDNDGIIHFPKKESMVICDSLNNPIRFESLGDVLVYMTKRGWEYVDIDSGKFWGLTVTLALIKKEITDDSQSMEYLFLKPKYGKRKKK